MSGGRQRGGAKGQGPPGIGDRCENLRIRNPESGRGRGAGPIDADGGTRAPVHRQCLPASLFALSVSRWGEERTTNYYDTYTTNRHPSPSPPPLRKKARDSYHCYTTRCLQDPYSPNPQTCSSCNLLQD